MRNISLIVFFVILLLGIISIGYGKPVVGGPCSYTETKGECTITSIDGIPTIKFKFVPTETLNLKNTFLENNTEALNSILNRTQEEYAGYLGIKCLDGLHTGQDTTTQDLEKCNITVGSVYDCQMNVETIGTCTPVTFQFLDKERNMKNITFVPWQKRNETECMEGCECHGAVVSCRTETGKIMNITAGRSGNIITIIVNNTESNTNLTLVINKTEDKNKTKLGAKISNGKYSEIKIMPDTASQIAIERLRLKVCSQTNNCTIELKEVGQGNQTKVHYEVQAEKEYKVLFLFKTKKKVIADIDSENGQVISVKKPWWAFLAKEE